MYVHSLELHQIKAFERLDLEFSRPEGEKPYAGMNVFVGGNASGKTTLLKCLSMALVGYEAANQLALSIDGWMRRGTNVSVIRVQVPWKHSDDKIPAPLVSLVGVDLTATTLDGAGKFFYPATSYWAELDASDFILNGFVVAYGAFRRLSGSSVDATRYASGSVQLARCLTLFREDASLAESDVWLRQEHARELERKDQGGTTSKLVDQVREFLNGDLLPSGFRIARVTVDEVFMETPNGGELPIRELSDGVRSTYALALDIIHHMSRAYSTADIFAKSEAGYTYVRLPGVVLIDELEAHLHPSWQLRICEWLKSRFPNIQFFVTTHSPLIAQAADPGGLFVLPLPDEIAAGQSVRRLAPHEQERVALGRAEKVLLGQAFGLKHTWSERADRLVQRWEALASRRNARGALPKAEQSEFEELSRQVEMIFDDVPDEVGSA
jgi:predicted ATPase